LGVIGVDVIGADATEAGLVINVFVFPRLIGFIGIVFTGAFLPKPKAPPTLFNMFPKNASFVKPFFLFHNPVLFN
jgi:hypothetical protein